MEIDNDDVFAVFDAQRPNVAKRSADSSPIKLKGNRRLKSRLNARSETVNSPGSEEKPLEKVKLSDDVKESTDVDGMPLCKILKKSETKISCDVDLPDQVNSSNLKIEIPDDLNTKSEVLNIEDTNSKITLESKPVKEENIESENVNTESMHVESKDNKADENRIKSEEDIIEEPATMNRSELDSENKIISSNQESSSVDTDLTELASTSVSKLSVASCNDMLSNSPRIKVHRIEALESCVHEVAVPPTIEYKPLKKPTTPPAKEYKFILDPFQKEAILCIDNDESVLVSAHTSAGKTVVAEYSIALSLKRKQRVIYTTPIKALSNQKYREFYEEFNDVGLVTGDVSINPTAGCLIMTTEILRNMLYHGSKIMKEVSWVIFDEIHYMRDKERGVVWEESLILLPNNVHYVFLSATIPNARQFAEWVAYVHNQPCHVVYTDFRPTPLQHYIYPAGSDGIHLIVNENRVFQENNFEIAMAKFENPKNVSDIPKRSKSCNASPVDCFKMVKMVLERNLAPAIIFSFSKKECEVHALQIAQLDFNTKEQKALVDEVFQNAMAILSEEDRHLPQVENVLPLLRRGIGIHHGGLLPILKETIEIMFSEGLIKALFATETFAMGLNMPARTVIFTGVRKFDGQNYRYITSGEYIQMSGRAGRRGLDEKGIVILMMDEKVSSDVCRGLLQGEADPLNSEFHLTYNMILNLLRVDEINPEYLIERSFFHFQNCSKIPHLEKQLKEVVSEYDKLNVDNESYYKLYYELKQQQKDLEIQYYGYILKPHYLVPFLQPGRLIKVCGVNDEEYDWGIVVSYKSGGKNERKGNDNSVTVYVLVPPIKNDTTNSSNNPMEIISLPVKNVVALSSLRIHFPENLQSVDNRHKVQKALNQIAVRFKNVIPKLDPVNDMGVKEPEAKNLCTSINKIKSRLDKLDSSKSSNFEEMYNIYSKKMELKTQMDKVNSDINEAMSLLQLKELKCRKRILRRLGFCTNSDIIELKGRVACEVSSAEEIVLTEMLFSGIFSELTTQQSVSLLSCFVCDERTSENHKISEELTIPLRKLKEIAKRVVKICLDSRLEVNEDEYVGQFRASLMDVVFAWCNGASFSEICTMTDIFEGSIIRCLKRLEEFLRQLVQATRTIGNSELEAKFSEGITLIKRDIVFATSLYL